MEEQNGSSKKRNIVYEVMMVIAGSFLIFTSIISVNFDLEMLLEEDETKIISDACNARDDLGNYSSEKIECINDYCYLKKANIYVASNCIDNKAKGLTEDEYQQILDNSIKVKDLCNFIDADGLYLNDNNDYCIDGLCHLKDGDMEYRSACPNIIEYTDEDLISMEYKDKLKGLCESYLKGNEIKDEQNECNYSSCKTYDSKSENTYSLSCEKNIYRIMDEDQVADEVVVNKYLEISCKEEEITETKYKDSIRCGNGLCSFHYNQVNYYKKCDK